MCKYLKMMLFNSETKKIKYFLDTPPPKKRLRDTNGRYMATRTCVCLYQQCVTWIFKNISPFYLILNAEQIPRIICPPCI